MWWIIKHTVYMLTASLLLLRCQGASFPCPPGCQCQEEMDHTHAVTCVLGDLEPTIGSLPSSVSRLIIQLAPVVPSYSQNLTLHHLWQLRDLRLDTNHQFTQAHLVYLPQGALQNNTKLTVFKSRVSLSWESDDVMSGLPNIRELMLSYTQVEWRDLPKLMLVSLSDKLHLERLSLRHFTLEPDLSVQGNFSINNTLGSLRNISIKALDLANNGLHYLTADFAESFIDLEYLDLSYNMLCHSTIKGGIVWLQAMTAIVSLPRLKAVDINHQGQYDGFKSNLTLRDLHPGIDNNHSDETEQTGGEGVNYPEPCECISRLPVPAALEYMSYAEMVPPAYAKIMRPPWLQCACFNETNKLKYLDIHGNHFLFQPSMRWDTVRLMNLKHLRYINFQDCDAVNFSRPLFANFVNLEVALLGRNKLGPLIGSQDEFYFLNNYKLKVLDLSFNGITDFPPDVLTTLTLLTHLNLSGNHLRRWDTKITMLQQLVLLNMSDNKFTSLSIGFQEQLTRMSSFHCNNTQDRTHLTVDISGSPLSCLCTDIQFVEWMHETQVDFHDKQAYTCSHPELGQVQLISVDLGSLRDHCFPNSWRTIVIYSVTSSLFTILVAVLITLYCKRWHLRYWWYLVCRGWQQHRHEQDPTEYEYDVFVAHSTEDADWVTGRLFDELEIKRGIRLCLYQRDILPNEILMHAIVERIEKSRYTLLVLSPNFVASNWCHFEMQMAHSKLCEEGKDIIVAVILEPLPPQAINESLHKLLKRKVYIEWPTGEEGHPLFWSRLATALQVPDSGSQETTSF